MFQFETEISKRVDTFYKKGLNSKNVILIVIGKRKE